MDKIVDIVKQILLQLGANQTVYVQILLFVVAITFLTTVVYGPFFKAADQRHKRTKGADAVAKDAAQEAKNLTNIYQTKARDINNKIKDVFDTKKSAALKTSAEIVSDSKNKAEQIANESRKNIDSQLKSAEAEVDKVSKEIAATLKDKFEVGL